MASYDPHLDKVIALLSLDGTLQDDAGLLSWALSGAAELSDEQSRFGSHALKLAGGTDCAVSDSLSAALLDADFTVEGWAWFSDVSASPFQGLFHQGNITDNDDRMQLQVETNAGVYGYHKTAAGTHYSENATSVLTAEAWLHWAWARLENVGLFFIGGFLVATGPYAGTPAGSPIIRLGSARGGNAQRGMRGYLSEVRVTKGLARYTENFTPTPEPFPRTSSPPGAYGEIAGTMKVAGTPAERDIIAISYSKQSVDDGNGGTVEKRLVVGETRSAPDGTYTLQTPDFLEECIVLGLADYGAVWQPNRDVVVGDRLRPTLGNETGHAYQITVAGNTGATEPAWWVPAGGSDLGVIGTATAQAVPAWPSIAHAPILPTPVQVEEVPWTAAQDIDNVRLWLDYSDANQVTIINGFLSAIVSKDPNARSFSQSAEAARPEHVANSQNGLATAHFDGTQYLDSDDAPSVWKFLHDGTKYQIYAVVRFGNAENTGTFYRLMGTHLPSSSKRGFSIMWDDRSVHGFQQEFRHFVSSGSSTAPIDHPSGDDFAPSNFLDVFSVESDSTASPASARSKIKRTDGVAATNNTSTTGTSTSDPELTLRIGGSADSSMVGEICEIVIRVGEPDATLDDYYYGWLAHKWGREAGLPGNHAHKTAAPIVPAV